MLDKNIREQIIALVHKEVVPAIGCTEPMAVALCVAKATKALGVKPETIDVFLSANILKNAMGVGIPGTGMIGLPIAVALGALVGKPEYQLEVLKDATPQSVEEGKKFISENRINIRLKEGISEKLYVEITCNGKKNVGNAAYDQSATAIIAGSHTNFVYLKAPDGVIFDKRCPAGQECEDDDIKLNMKIVYEFASETPLEEISFILETKKLNEKAANDSLKGDYGHDLGKTMTTPLSRKVLGDSIFTHMISITAAACDGRMGGAMFPVMSNSGSGNQGICATNPVVVFAEDNHNTDEQLIRALILSHLTAIYIKQSLGKLSALCGCVVASIGSSCGITYLMGGNYNNICNCVKNMIANLTGMICDGAKPSCALKISSGVSTAVLSAILSMENKYVTSAEGIVDDDVDKCIHNLTSIGANAMTETDKAVLDIMTHKSRAEQTV